MIHWGYWLATDDVTGCWVATNDALRYRVATDDVLGYWAAKHRDYYLRMGLPDIIWSLGLGKPMHGIFWDLLLILLVRRWDWEDWNYKGRDWDPARYWWYHQQYCLVTKIVHLKSKSILPCISYFEVVSNQLLNASRLISLALLYLIQNIWINEMFYSCTGRRQCYILLLYNDWVVKQFMERYNAIR